ncbi:uncharacterized protein BDW70DRAFT_159014 [Aspergillus foveolatus]|uniref:uncharacterized protein n=1 Tax=Aspergillus foveolatus TaxID=210207 RepID=UPI003CCD6CA7
MTIYGMTFIQSHVYDSRKNAKVSVCKGALKKLKVEFPNWVVPEGPRDSLVSSGWDWVETLQEYCVHQRLPEPLYTKYAHHKGYRHEVEVGGGAYFAPLKYYAAELQSKQSAAHVALYDLLVREDYGSADTEEPSSLKKSNKALLTVNPWDHHRKSTERIERECPSNRKRSFEALLDESAQDSLCSSIGQRAPARKLKDYKHSGIARRHGGKNQLPRTFSQVKPAPGNANLQPLKNCRLAVVEAPLVQEERHWKVTPSDILREIQNVENWVAKLERGESRQSVFEEVCSLLKLEHPEILLERSDGRLIETEGQYTAAAYFEGDPFLTRAGAIGRIQTFSGIRTAVHEACAWNVYNYLIDLVKEDMMLEDNAAKERETITRWGDTARK